MLSRDQLVKALGNSNINAPISGEITDVRIKKGDTIGKDGTLLTITDKSKLMLLLPFNNAYGNEIYEGQKASVYIFDTALDEMHTAEGVISLISLSEKSEEKPQIYNVGFTIENNGQFDDSMIGSAEIKLKEKTLKSVGSAKLSYAESIGLKTETGGLIISINGASGQFVEKGDFIAEIENTDLTIELETKNLNLEDMYNQLDYAKDKLSQYKIYSDIDGILSMENIKKGDNVKSGQTLFDISNYDLMEFQISVDELDIANIEKGQTVNITVDALPDTNTKPLEGKVTKIALEGSSSNGVSTYPVTVQLTKSDDRLKVGMNVNGEIVITEKKDTLYIPIEAVQKRGNTHVVYVKSVTDPTLDNNAENNQNSIQRTEDTYPITDREPLEGQQNSTERQDRQPGRQRFSNDEEQAAKGERRFSEQQFKNSQGQLSDSEQQGEGYYSGAVAKIVKIGINNDEYIEIISGLKEGDIIILPQSYTMSGTSNTQNNRFTGGGGMQGGMPFSMPGGQRR